jgi:hypothetical protein
MFTHFRRDEGGEAGKFSIAYHVENLQSRLRRISKAKLECSFHGAALSSAGESTRNIHRNIHVKGGKKKNQWKWVK